MACGSATELRLVLCNTKHEVEVAEVEEVTWVSSDVRFTRALWTQRGVINTTN